MYKNKHFYIFQLIYIIISIPCFSVAAKINPAAGGDTGTKRPLDEGSGMDWIRYEFR